MCELNDLIISICKRLLDAIQQPDQHWTNFNAHLQSNKYHHIQEYKNNINSFQKYVHEAQVSISIVT